MTHDELLSIMDNYTFKDSAEPVKALRAVVELHRPVHQELHKITGCILHTITTKTLDPKTNKPFFAGSCGYCRGCYWEYPCPTIQAIEKELNQ